MWHNPENLNVTQVPSMTRISIDKILDVSFLFFSFFSFFLFFLKKKKFFFFETIGYKWNDK